MKKLFFALACVIGLLTFASCDQEVIDDIMAQKPTVEFVAEDGFISSSTSLYFGEELNFKVKVAPNSGSEAELAHFDFSITDDKDNLNVVFNENPDFDDATGENIFTFTFTPEVASNYIVTASVTDKAGKANTAVIIVDVVQPVEAEMGVYEGTLTINGHITSNQIAGYDTYDEDYNMEDLPVTITLGTLDENNRVAATIVIEETPVTLEGTYNEDSNLITFDEFTIRKTINLFVDVNLDITMNIYGTLNDDDTMTLRGTAEGTGKTLVMIAYLEVNMNGSVIGTLDKVVE